MTVAVTGASGNVGTALLRRLTAPGSGVAEVRGLARRRPPDVAPYDRACGGTWPTSASRPARPSSTAFLDGADAVVHLAWALQPGRQPEQLRRVERRGHPPGAVAAAGPPRVAHVVHMSSLGAYAAGSRQPAWSAEDWPTTGIPIVAVQPRTSPSAERVVRQLFGPAPRHHADRRPADAGAAARGGQRDRPLLPRPAALRAAPGWCPARWPGWCRCRCPTSRGRRSCTPTTSPTRIVRMLDRRAAGPFNLSAEPVFDADGIARALGTPAGAGARPRRCGRAWRPRSPRT